MDEQPQTLDLMDKFTGVRMCCSFYCTFIILVNDTVT